MPRNVTVYFADGSRHEYQGVPDDAMPEQIAARAGRDFQGKQIRHLARAPAAAEPERTLGGYTKEAFKGLIPGLVGMGETVITGAASLLPEEAEQAVRKPVEEFATGVRETFAPAPGYEDTLVRKISEGVGSTVPFLGLGVLGAAGRVAAAGLGVGAGAGEARQKAEEAGATEGERGLATALGTIPGALESLPPIRILRRFGFGDEAIKEVAGLAPALGRVAKAGGEEALQEASSQVLQNLIAKGVYAPDEAVFGGVGEAATVGGGAGAVVSAIAELALGRRLRGPEAEAPGTEEAPDTEEDLTPEQLAPKTGRAARPSPVRAKTLDELRGQLPAAPVVPEKARKEKAPVEPREPMVFERIKEPTPEALQEAAEFVAQFPEGSKNFNLFKAKSIAKKLGYEGIPQKGVGRVDIEPLLRMAVAPQPSVATEAAPAVEAAVLEAKKTAPAPEAVKTAEPTKFVGLPNFNYTITESPNYDLEALSPEDADFELEVLQGQAERGRLTPQNFAQSEIGKRLDTTQIMTVNAGLQTDPVGTVKSLREKLKPPAAPAETATLSPVTPAETIEAKAAVEAAPVAEPVIAAPVAEPVVAAPVAEPVVAAPVAEPVVAAPAKEAAAPKAAAPKAAAPKAAAPKAAVPAPAVPRVQYKDKGDPFQQGLEFYYDGLYYSVSPIVGMHGQPVLNVYKDKSRNDLLGDHYANNKRGEVDGRVGDVSQIDRYNLPPEISKAIKDYLSSSGIGMMSDPRRLPKSSVDAAGKRLADAVSAEMAKYETPTTETTSEPVSTRAGEAVAGATAGSPALPVQRGVPAGREVAESGVSGVEPARGVAERVDEREEDVSPALEPQQQQLFFSIAQLNENAPVLTEQAGERAPSLRVELRKAKRDYDDGVLTGDQLAETTGDLLLKTQKERIVQPRKRGADYIRERLMNARRNGFISQEGIDLAEWFIRQNPLLVADLGISIRNQPKEMEGAAGFYNNISRVINLFKGAGDSQTATHEILHHLERLMPANIRSGILKAYVKQLTKAKKNAKTDAEKTFFSAITNYHYFTGEAKNAEYKKALDAIQKGEVPKSFYQYVNPSEFWAVNGARIVQGRYGIPPGIVGQIKRWLRDFLEKAKDVFGLKSDAAIIRALDSLAKADGEYQTDRMLVEVPGYRSVEPIKTGKSKKPKPTKPKKSLGELRREASAKMMKPGVIRQVINKLTSPETNYETIVKNFQNVSRKVKKIEEDLRVANKLISVGEDKNNINDQTSIAANRAAYIVATEVEPVAKRLRESLASYARVVEGTIKDALEKADGYRIALHEPERRETKYLRNVPLNNTTKMEFLPGEPAMTAADARAALEKRRSLADTPQKQEAVLDMMRYLAANHADPLGYSPVKAQLEAKGKEVPLEMTTDFYDDIYNVIGTEYTQEELDATREEYEGLDAETKAAVDQVFADFDALNELNKNLNRRANYWTDKVDNVIGTYGWKHYAPFKGNPRADKTLDTDTEYLSGELSEAPQSFEGRRTEFDSPILQSIAESYFAASRAGRGTDVTQTIKNLIKLNIIKSARPKVFTFEERNAPDFDYSQVQGRDKVLHYNEDGSVEVFSIKDPDVLEAIKVPYREMNLVVKIGNALTSKLGQLHTRYNPAFAPMDLIRNTLTNAGLISAREGGKEAREYLTAVAADVARFRMVKAGKLSNLLAKNNIAKLNELAKTDLFYRDALEMREYGGATFYRMSFNISNTMEELKEQVGPKKIITQPNMLARWIDAYNDGFELTSRVSAYTLRKQNNIAEAKKKGLNVDDPKVMEDINKEAAAFSLSLMDFRKIGKYGREMGAWFMFIRPAATGAVDAIDALRPGFFLKPKSAVEKGFARLEPEIQELFETQGLAEEIKRIQGNKRPDKKKIAALEQEIVGREKAFDAFEKRQLTRAKNARNTAMFTIATGAALYAMAVMASGDDDEGRNRVLTDDMSRWTRYLRLPVIGDKGFFQVPWGFGVSSLASAGAQVAALANGQSSFKDFAGNMVEIGMDSFLPIPTSRINPFENFGAWLLDSAAPSAARPLVEFVLNVDAMGNPIYNSRAGKYADAFSGSTRPSEIHREISELIFNTTDGEVSISPDSIAFFLNNYADAPNHLAENSFNLVLTSMGDKNFDAKKDTFLLRSFIGRNSNYDAREYAEAEKGIKKLSQQLKTFEDLGTPEQVNKFYRKNPNADILVDTYNKGRGQLSKLQAERKQILLDKSLTPKQREDFVQNVLVEMNYLKKLLVEDFKAYSGN
jgi:hypothetical protein